MKKPTQKKTERNRKREKRKDEHLSICCELEHGPGSSYLECVQLIHNCMPETSVHEIDTAVKVCGIGLEIPIIINAITGGSKRAAEVNRMLGSVAAEMNMAIAVGSQTVAIDDPALEYSFLTLQELSREVPVFANVGLDAGVKRAVDAVAMIDADALQVHLNPAQEMVMAEGERCFTHGYDRLRAIVAAVDVPVIVKEVGCGIGKEQANGLIDTGIAALDVGGRGGTNFIAIEQKRTDGDDDAFLTWGIPTAASIMECSSVRSDHVDIIASGGIGSGLDVAKSVALGADCTAIAGPLLKAVVANGVKGGVSYCQRLVRELKMVMVLTGCNMVGDLKQTPKIVHPPLASWIEQRR